MLDDSGVRDHGFELLSKDGSSSPPDFEFLGDLLHIDQDGKLHVSITEANELKFIHRGIEMFGLITDIEEKAKKYPINFPDSKNQIIELLKSWANYGLGWLSAFAEADDIETHRSNFISFFKSLCPIDVMAAELIQSATPDDVYPGY